MGERGGRFSDCKRRNLKGAREKMGEPEGNSGKGYAQKAPERSKNDWRKH